MRTVGGALTRILRQNWLFLLVVATLVIAYLALRTPASDVASVAEVDALLQGGQPVLVEFYANA